MEKTATLNLRVDPALKKNAESIMNKLGIPMSTAVDIYLNQIVMTGGIPFAVKLPAAPENIDISAMTSDQIHEKIRKGYESYLDGNTQDAAEVFNKFRQSLNK